MVHTVHAALAVANVGRPRTHSGAISLFNRHFVRTNQLDVQFARDLQDAYDLRQRSDYEVFVSIGEDQVKEIVQRAEVFVLEIRNLLNLVIDN